MVKKEEDQLKLVLGLRLKKYIKGTKRFIDNGNGLNGEPFALLVHVINGYGCDGTDQSRLENPFCDKDGKFYCSMSLITNYFLGHVYQNGKEVILGYTNITPDMYIASAPYDMFFHGDNISNKISYEIGPKYIDPLITAKRTIHRHNEFVLKRVDKDGKELIPTCIVSYNSEINESQLEASRKYNLPILKIDANRYLEQQKKKMRDTYDELVTGEMPPAEGEVLDFLYSLTAYLYGFSWKNMNLPYEDDFIFFTKIPIIIKELLSRFESTRNLIAIEEISEFVNDHPSKRNYTVFKEKMAEFNDEIKRILEGMKKSQNTEDKHYV